MNPLLLASGMLSAIEGLLESTQDPTDEEVDQLVALSAALAHFALAHAHCMGLDIQTLTASVEAQIAVEKAAKH